MTKLGRLFGVFGSAKAQKGAFSGLALLAAVAVAAWVQETAWRPFDSRMSKEQMRPAEGQVSPEFAVRSARLFLRRIRVSVPNGVPRVGRTIFPGSTDGIYDVDFPPVALLAVNIRTGEAVNYTNTQRTREQGQGIRPRGGPKFADDLSARIYLRNLAKRLGIPSEFKLAQFTFCGEGDPRISDANRAGAIMASFEPMPYGYRMYPAAEEYPLEIDPADGALVMYSHGKRFRYAIDAHELKLTFAKANELARPIVRREGLGSGIPAGGDYPRGAKIPRMKGQPSFLAFVVPKGSRADGGEGSNRLFHMRLAWVLCYPGDDQVWIDAGDGRVLHVVDMRESFSSKRR